MYKALPKLLLLSSCSVFSLAAVAGGPEIIQAGWWPYPAGATATALSGQLTTGFADGMIPVYGKPTEFFYFDPQGQINNSDQYAVSAGIGGRYLWQEKGILGAYVFGDYNHSENSNSFWFVSPGVEYLGDVIDVTGNLYVPVGTQRYTEGPTVFGQDIGIYDGVTFAGHTEYDELYQRTETDGFGGDIDVAYRIPFNPYNPKLHLGGYFSNPKDADKDRAGGAIRLEFPFSENLNILVGDSYDNVSHNTVRAGASYSFGGRHTSYNYKENNLESRMVDLIQRNLIANSSDIHNSQPISENALDTNGTDVYLTNISFFVPDPTLLTAVNGEDGSYENPYTGMTQAQIDDANAQGNNNFFVQSGTYGDPATGMGSLTLADDNVFGRESVNSKPFVKKAEGTNRPEFFFNNATDGFIVSTLAVDTSNTISSLYLFGVGAGAGTGIVDNNNGLGANPNINQTLTVDNMDISQFAGRGLFVQSSAGAGNTTLNVINSYIHNDTGNEISVTNSTTSTMTVNLDGVNMVGIGSGGARGLSALNDGSGVFNLNITNTSSSNNGSNGIFARNGGSVANAQSGTMTINIDHSDFSNNIGTAGQPNILLSNMSTGSMSTNLDHVHADNNPAAVGMQVTVTGSGSSQVSISDSTFNNNASYGLALGTITGATGALSVEMSNGSQVLGNPTGAVTMTTAGGSTAPISLVVNTTAADPVLWNGNVARTVAGGPVTATFNADNGQIPLSGTGTVNVYCDSTGFCVSP